MAALLAMLGMMGGNQQTQAPVQTPGADIKSFEEQFGDLFGTTLGTGAPKPQTAKAAQGGSIDELLKLLRG
jgi:hypothetical protein